MYKHSELIDELKEESEQSNNEDDDEEEEEEVITTANEQTIRKTYREVRRRRHAVKVGHDLYSTVAENADLEEEYPRFAELLQERDSGVVIVDVQVTLGRDGSVETRQTTNVYESRDAHNLPRDYVLAVEASDEFHEGEVKARMESQLATQTNTNRRTVKRNIGRLLGQNIVKDIDSGLERIENATNGGDDMTALNPGGTVAISEVRA